MVSMYLYVCKLHPLCVDKIFEKLHTEPERYAKTNGGFGVDIKTAPFGRKASSRIFPDRSRSLFCQCIKRRLYGNILNYRYRPVPDGGEIAIKQPFMPSLCKRVRFQRAG